MPLPVVVICGSIRQSLDDMRWLEAELAAINVLSLFPTPTLQKVAADSADYDGHPDNLRADALHLYRVMLAAQLGGRLLAVKKPDGSIGESTWRELLFGQLLNMTTLGGTREQLLQFCSPQ